MRLSVVSVMSGSKTVEGAALHVNREELPDQSLGIIPTLTSPNLNNDRHDSSCPGGQTTREVRVGIEPT